MLEGRKPAPRQLLLEKANDAPNPPSSAQWELADLANLSVERVREFGSVFLALALWRRLGLHDLLSELMDCGRETVTWAEVAVVLTAGKFCGQASELGVAEEWYARTALEDLSGIAPELINDERLYRGLDQLGKHKDRLCEHLMQRYRDLFGVRFEFLLYDVASTYFEGQALGNTKAARGYSRDQRSDCKQVCLGLVCTPEGLPLNYEVFAGNRVDVTTVGELRRPPNAGPLAGRPGSPSHPQRLRGAQTHRGTNAPKLADTRQESGQAAPQPGGRAALRARAPTPF